MTRPIYLDYHATTPVDPRVLDAMLPYFTEQFGNASSRNHAFGWAAGDAVEKARRQVATLIGASAKEVVFTSGATEANNLAIKGVAARAGSGRRRIVTVCTEHHAVLETCHRLAQEGFDVVVLPVREDGLLDLAVVQAAVTDATLLVSVMAVNNEIGVCQPLRAVADITHAAGAVFHVDAAQAVGKVAFDVEACGADLAAFTAHKMYGPKGVGALYVRRRPTRVEVEPLFDGGSHERGMRPGTLNVPGIVGLGAAAALCTSEMAAETTRIAQLRDALLAHLMPLGGVQVNGSVADRVPHNLNVSFAGVEGAALHLALGDIAVSSGAACTTDSAEPSHVLSALGVPADLARATIRFGLGRMTSGDEIEYAGGKVREVVQGLRERTLSLGA